MQNPRILINSKTKLNLIKNVQYIQEDMSQKKTQKLLINIYMYIKEQYF